MSQSLVVTPYNGVHLALLAFTVLASVAVWLLFGRRAEKTKTVALVALCCANLILYFVYKDFLSRDADFLVKTGIERFNWFNELPLQLCNVNLFLIPIGVLTKNRSILGFSFFLAPLGAAMALLFPDTAFIGCSLAVPRMIGYYFTHIFLVVCGVSMATLGFFRPRVKDLPQILVVFLIAALGAHGVNTLLRVTDLCGHANYFYTYGSDISILALFWSWIPVPLLYELPTLAILLGYMAVVCGVFALAKKKKKA